MMWLLTTQSHDYRSRCPNTLLQEKVVFEVCDLGKAVIIIGLLWLQKHNPEINWKMGEVKMIHCPSECNVFI